jgi:nitrate/nitrite transporter NarK
LPPIVRAFRHRNYRLFFAGQLISLVGTWMQMVAESWLVFRLTGSSALLGLSAFAGQIPVFLFAPIGGAVADRFNRHRIIVITQSVSMVLPLILAALTLSGRVRVWRVFVVNGARILGPSVAGLTIAAVGEGWCFLINGVSYLAVISINITSTDSAGNSSSSTVFVTVPNNR